jgi:hypothetical protein
MIAPAGAFPAQPKRQTTGGPPVEPGGRGDAPRRVRYSGAEMGTAISR